MSYGHADAVMAGYIPQVLASDRGQPTVHWYVISINGKVIESPRQGPMEKFNVGENIFGLGLYDSDMKRYNPDKSPRVLKCYTTKLVDDKCNDPQEHNANVVYATNGAHVVIPISTGGQHEVTVGRSTLKGFAVEPMQKPASAVTGTSRINRGAGNGVSGR
jgi:hypothetical protein